MANIEGTSAPVPGVYSNVETQTKGVSVPGGVRLAAFMGEGSRSEVLVTAATGGGLDGFNADYTSSTSGRDGRHFRLSLSPVISNRTKLFRNGIPLVGFEEAIGTDSFDSAYDYRIDIATGEIEMQAAYFVDQGGAFYTAGSLNTGDGSIRNLTIADLNAPTETWTIKCAAVQRDGYGVPVTETAKFIAFGSVSGTKLDGYGAPIVWLSDNGIVSNGVISFSVYQDPSVSASSLQEGDTFIIKVKSGVLLKNDSLTASYIAETDLNDPTFFDDMDAIRKRHGAPSLDNNLSLGASIGFANSTPGLVALQTMPAVPRRSSFALSPKARTTSSSVEDYLFPLPAGVTPNVDSGVHFFITNPATGIETQIIPNKLEFFSVSDTSTSPTLNTFVFSATDYAYDYTVIQRPLVTKFGSDATITANGTIPGTALLSSSSFSFTAQDAGNQVRIEDSANSVNIGVFSCTGATDGSLNLSFSDFVSETGVTIVLKNADGTTSSTFADGVITPDVTDKTKCVITSATTDFSAISGLNSKVAVITSAAHTGNKGQFLISGAVLGNIHGMTVRKYFVTETPVTFEIIDATQSGSFVAVNKSVVPLNYALRVTLIDERDADFYDVGWVTALAALEKTDVDIVVPLPKQTISAIFQNTVSHCRTMSNTENKLERVAFIGAIDGLLPENVLGEKDAAVEDIGILEGIQGHNVNDILSGNIEDLTNYDVQAAYGNTYRAVYFYPDEIVVGAGTDRVATHGFYMAAAAAGYLCSVSNVAVPLTNKVLTGITILKTKVFSPTTLKKLVNHGMTVLQPVTGGGKVIQGKTTTDSGFPEEEEISIIFIRDRIAKSMRAGFEGFIGLPEDPSTLGTLTSRAVGLLNSYITQNLITSFTNLKVAQDDVDPRQWNISFQCKPVYGINYIYIKIDVGSS